MSFHYPPCVMKDTDQFYVRICGCGVVHLNFGATIVNLSPEAFIAVSETLTEVSCDLKKKITWDDPVNAEDAAIDPSGNVIFGRFPAQGSSSG